MMALLIDTLILALLAGTLGYAFLVDRRVRALMAALEDLRPMVGEFSAAVDKSETSVSALKSMAQGLADSPVRKRAADSHDDRGAAAGLRFSSVRTPSVLPAGVTRVSGKADLVRSFFEATRGRNA